MVIFGASGDLTKRKLLPALYSLTRERMLPGRFAVDRLRAPADVRRRVPRRDARRLRGVRAPPPGRPRACGTASRPTCSIKTASYDDPKAFVALRERLEQIERTLGLPGNRVFYLSIPPSSFATVVRNLGVVGAGAAAVGPRAAHFSRVIIEKPFGTDLATAQRLNHDIHETLTEKQIYRIDHYLGKETVQNLLVFRFANGIFEPIWNNRFVDHVQITGAETVGVEGRGGYFEQAGILRDMVQNHLFQVVSLAAMEPPVALDADGVRDEKLKVLKALRPMPSSEIDANVVRAQYAAGSIAGRAVPGYREEPGVSPTSQTETYVGHEVLHRLVALDGRAVLPALGQAHAQAGHRDRDPLQGGAAPAVRAARRRGRAAQRAVDPHPARRGHLAELRIQASRARRWRSRRSPWSSATARRSASSRPRPTSA